VISPLALEAVRRIDALFEIERWMNRQRAPLYAKGNGERRDRLRAPGERATVGSSGWSAECRAPLSKPVAYAAIGIS
jgi:hypothetical protein